MDEFAAKDSRTAQGYTELEASSLAVGLPEGLMGNSEVGHLNIGAGRVVWQDVVRIDQTLRKKELGKIKNLTDCFKRAKDTNGRLHLLGLVSDGGVHSHINHLYGLLQVAKEIGVPHVYVHFFGDGRDTDPKSGAGYMRDLLAKMKELEIGQIATVVGRYFIMDRDKRWDRVEIGLKGVVLGEGEESTDPVATVEERYSKGENDEFLKPIIVGGKESRVQDDDTLFFFNYRSDRVREVTQLLGDVDRSPKPNFPYPKNIAISTMTQYKTDYPFPIAFEPQHMGNVLAEWLGKQGVKQCHVAETEKYAHVTFFFNGGVEMRFPGEDRDMVPSPKVATYDLDPKMSAAGVADRLGIYEAAIEGVTATDNAIGQVYQKCKEEGYVLFVTADHGNAEEMLNEEGKPKTSHTTNKVPFVMANAPKNWSLKKQNGVLGDVAPTILEVMGLHQPKEMGGTSLLSKA